MPKRKAVETLEVSDGEQEDEYYSFPNTPIQSPFIKSSFPNNIHRPPSPKKIGSSILPMFNFGQSGPQQTPKLGNNISSPPSTKLPNLGFGETAATKKPVTINNKSFSMRMKDLNKAFISSCRNAYSKSPSHSLVPLVKDYLHHSRVLMEQHRSKSGAEDSSLGSSGGALINGMNAEVKSFKYLGEFFDDFEQKYIGTKTTRCGGDETPLRSNSDLTNSDNSSTLSSATSEKSNSFSSNASPSTLDNAYNKKPTIGSPLKSNTTLTPSISSTSSPFTPSTKITFGLSSANGSVLPFAQKSTDTTPTSLPFSKPNSVVSSSPILSTTLGAGSKLGAISSSSSTLSSGTQAAPKPAAAFTGFSFFTTPPSSTSSLSSTLSFNSKPAAAASEGSAVATSTSSKGEDGGENDADNENDPSDEPPKVEVNQVVEEDSLFSKRCKVFTVMDGKPKDKGIGMLYVKKTEGGKYQVVVRADNNLGTVILNILLQKSLPISKNSKNSLMTVDLQASQKGTPIILKVKSEDDAYELLAKLKEFQQLS